MTRKKMKPITFTITADEHAQWMQRTQDLIFKRIFRNKSEIMQTLIIFLNLENDEEVLKWKNKTLIT